MAHIRTVSVSSKGQIVIPEEMRKDLAIKEGTKLVMIEKDGKIVVEKESALLPKLENLGKEEKEKMLWLLVAETSLSKDWLNEKEDAAWKDL